MDPNWYEVGKQIKHKKHGPGTVVDIYRVVVVEFPEIGIKKFKLSAHDERSVQMPSVAESRVPADTTAASKGATPPEQRPADGSLSQSVAPTMCSEVAGLATAPTASTVVSTPSGVASSQVGRAMMATAPANSGSQSANELRQSASLPLARLSLRCQRSLYYMTHVDNLPSVLRHGILAANRVRRRGLTPARIDNRGVQDLRGRVTLVQAGQRIPLHDFAPLYFTVRTPMLYSRRHVQNRIVYVEIGPAVLDLSGVVLSDGNAATQGLRRDGGRVEVTVACQTGEASHRTYVPYRSAPARQMSGFYAGPEALDRIPWGDVDSEAWGSDGEKTRRKHAEALIPGRIPPTHFQRLHVRTADLQTRVAAILHEARMALPIRVTPEYYFPDPPAVATSDVPSDPFEGEDIFDPAWLAYADHVSDENDQRMGYAF